MCVRVCTDTGLLTLSIKLVDIILSQTATEHWDFFYCLQKYATVTSYTALKGRDIHNVHTDMRILPKGTRTISLCDFKN